MARALPSHHCGLGSILAWCHMLVEFVVILIVPRVLLRVHQIFLPLQKPTSPNSNLIFRIGDLHGNQLRLMYCKTRVCLLIHQSQFTRNWTWNYDSSPRFLLACITGRGVEVFCSYYGTVKQ